MAASDPTAPASAVDVRLARLVELTEAAARAFDQTDLLDAAARLSGERPGITVVVVGDFKRGKTSLVNALAGSRVLRTLETTTTALPTVVRNFDRTWIVGVDLDGAAHPLTSVPTTAATADGMPLARVEVHGTFPALGAMALVDCPAAPEHLRAARAATRAAALGADVALVVTDCTQPLTASEIELVGDIAERVAATIVVSTKADLVLDVARRVDADRAALARADLDLPVVAVSNELVRLGRDWDDAELLASSGLDALRDLLASHLGVAADLRRRRDVEALLGILDDLRGRRQADLDALASPEELAARSGALRETIERCDRLAAGSARWQRLLGEVTSDTQGDLELFITERGRQLNATCDAKVEEIDPAKDWETFEPWLRDQVVELTTDVFAALESRLQGLVDQIRREYTDDGFDLTNVPDGVLDGSEAVDLTGLEVSAVQEEAKSRLKGAASGMVALRGGYSGLTMFSMLGGVVGMVIPNPITIAIGIGLGQKAIRDERKRALDGRRKKAAAAGRQFTDAALGRTRNALRSEIRNRQRDIRDAWTTVASDRGSAARSQHQALQAEASSAGDLVARAGALRADIAKLDKLHEHVTELGRLVGAAAASPA